ncbi:hypothetical protein [Serratia proteamaculans]
MPSLRRRSEQGPAPAPCGLPWTLQDCAYRELTTSVLDDMGPLQKA